MRSGPLLRRLIGVGLMVAAPAHARGLAVGDVLLCASTEGQPSVLAWVGRVETWSDHGATGPLGAVALAHLQLQVDGGGASDHAAHAPFEADALSGCQPVGADRMTADPQTFEEGYAVWREAVPDGAGAFAIGPADAYWATVGIRDGAMGP